MVGKSPNPVITTDAMSLQHLSANITLRDATRLRIAYYDHTAPRDDETKGVILFLHGFPQTSFQFRYVLPLVANHGYRCIAPDYRGAGGSSKPGFGASSGDFRKSTMAADMITLLDAIGITEPVHVVGHDIGGMVAFALASRWPERVRSVCWGECPLPGTKAYRDDMSEPGRAKQQFHFIFHCAPDGLAEALVAGKERLYISHFFAKLTHNLAAFPSAAVGEYVSAYSQPGALSAAFAAYRAFEEDEAENESWIATHGKCPVPTMILSGQYSRHREEAKHMALEVTREAAQIGVVDSASHYLAEENPAGFARAVEQFISKY
ncbi:hypothetical protein JX265_008159 [Neoarthrinium moseri]|uniref:AB hydrolase-1 domain-containing protein n=1 Tax=Neoarthrinium moseri TaxID=1658444 RepID=A0A9Q0AK98_9PEZI|nr:uncharacterized protein JN550_004856 [Neoarthrinium moseri]KAI1852036.1 hypothetical protein JX266_002889 [Neoarthrinium moseri]KAI1865112.1 hypothetical protein JX265_008159 [Neoarthrinium moseri]KAI1870710.1 hypothetical protein JN550_004856 [Neoarthrinium moseri]